MLKKMITKDDMKRAVVIFNSRHRRFNIEYDAESDFLCVKDRKQGEYKVFITIPKIRDIDELLIIFEDLIKDLS